ncbi:MAG: rhodanese-like domain-containing protein, partial [Betaproteobacteria bacterium]
MANLIELRKHFFGILIALACVTWLSHPGRVGHDYKVTEVDVFGARQLLDKGALVIDVRGQEQYNFRHIPGAVLITIEELRARIPAKLAAEARSKAILVYCN